MIAGRGGGHGLDKELALKANEKHDPKLEEALQKWIEDILQEPFPQDMSFAAALKDGQRLCRFINVIIPGTVKTISSSSINFKQMENVSHFIKACRALGVEEFELFETTDLYEGKDLGVVVNCLLVLARVIKQNVPSFQGPFPPDVGRRRGRSTEVQALASKATTSCSIEDTVSTGSGSSSSQLARATSISEPPPRPLVEQQQLKEEGGSRDRSGTEPVAVAARGAGFGLDAELAAMRDAKYDRGLEADVRQWIEEVTGELFPDPSFGESLKDGQILCRFINTIKPNTIKKIETSKMPFKQMENISAFIRACRSLGVPEPDLFETIDLFELKDLSTVVRCLDSLGRVIQKAVPEFAGPHFGVKLAQENRRRFDPNQQRSVVATKLMQGSAPTMERLGFDKSTSVTFGYEYSGASVLDGATKGLSSPPTETPQGNGIPERKRR